MLSPKEAEKELELAEGLMPGPWVKHSISVAVNARLIAEKTDGLDSDTAYSLGLMHDIGRREGFKAIMHILDGYNYMMQIRQPEIARICLTHSFPIQDIHTFIGKYDCSEEELAFLEHYITSVVYDDYDRLIQLCDAISLPNGACIMEKRLIDVALRHGLPSFTLDKWKAFMNLKKYFDELCHCNLYSLLPNVMENSCESLI